MHENQSDDEDSIDEDSPLLDTDTWRKMSVVQKMNRLKSVNVTGQLCKLTVEQDDILSDAVAFYKNPSFDPARPLRVSFRGQPAIDTGGVLRVFFSAVKEKFCAAELFSIFEGPHSRLLFRYDQSCLAAGIPEILGKLVAQSLVHGCGGFPYLAPSHYYYIATTDIQRASAYASIYDVYDTEKRDMLDKVQYSMLSIILINYCGNMLEVDRIVWKLTDCVVMYITNAYMPITGGIWIMELLALSLRYLLALSCISI